MVKKYNKTEIFTQNLLLIKSILFYCYNSKINNYKYLNFLLNIFIIIIYTRFYFYNIMAFFEIFKDVEIVVFNILFLNVDKKILGAQKNLKFNTRFLTSFPYCS